MASPDALASEDGMMLMSPLSEISLMLLRDHVVLNRRDRAYLEAAAPFRWDGGKWGAAE